MPGILSKLDSVIVDHRKVAQRFDQDVAEAVGLLRVRPQLFGKDTEDWKMLEKTPKNPAGLDPITFNDMTPNKIHSGRILHLTNIDIPLQFQFESADLRVTQHVSAMLVVQDANAVAHRAFVNNFVLPTLIWEYEDEETIRKMGDVDAKNLEQHLGLGFKISVIDPELNMASDGKLALVVNDPANLIVVKVENADKTCRFCFKRNSQTWNLDALGAIRHITAEKHAKRRIGNREVTNLEQAAKNHLHHFYQHRYMTQRPEWTVYDLERLCYEDVCPSLEPRHDQLRRDFGFANCQVINDEGKLIGLYQGLIKIMRVDMVRFHKAAKEGILELFIRECFATYFMHHPNNFKGAYYAWFLEHPSIVHRARDA